jgi:hypothetical protein
MEKVAALDTLEINKKGLSLNTLEQYHVYKVKNKKQNIHVSDVHTDHPVFKLTNLQ